MISLNTAKIETKIVLKWGGIFLFIIFLFFMLIKILPFVINIFAPAPPPEAAFGKLPPIPYPNQVKENLSYSLDIITSSTLMGILDEGTSFNILSNSFFCCSSGIIFCLLRLREWVHL